jgi:ABC-2 type transport system ATP-binding protein
VTGTVPIAIEVTRLSKRFTVPVERIETLKQRAVHPLRREHHRELRVLQDISFEVARGEFFGVVGRNGSGKTTLLKLLAGVYAADSGRIRVAGLVGPVIELGAGFQPELSARDNVFLNGLMMGLTPKEARSRFDAVMDFAELREFTELKLKNYSSGMRVRLAFAIMMQTDPDVVLLDEVLAVGDPPFQRRCQQAFEEFKRRNEKTVVLVSHAMPNIQRHCDRAMLLENGRIELMGDPEGVAERYEELKPRQPAPPPDLRPDREQVPVKVIRIASVDRLGRAKETIRDREPVRLEVSLEADRRVEDPRLLVQLINERGVLIFAPPPIPLERDGSSLPPGKPITLKTTIENRLPPGRYTASCVVAGGPRGPRAATSRSAKTEFELSPGRQKHRGSGLVDLDFEVRIDGDGGPLGGR